MQAKHEVFEFKPTQPLPDIDLVFTGCRTGPNGYAFDVVDFQRQKIDRWELPFVRNEKWLAEIKANMYAGDLPLGYKDAGQYCDDHFMTPHTVQLAPQGRLFATFGVAESGFGIVTLDTHSDEYKFVGSDSEPSKLFASTGDFDATFREFYFATWPTTNTPRDAVKEVPNSIEIESLAIDSLDRRHRYTVAEKIVDGRVEGTGLPRNLHQVTLSDDGRYIVCAPFNAPVEAVQIDPVPGGSAAGEGASAPHQVKKSLVLENVITIDLQESKHWLTKIPVPVPAHIEFDLLHPKIFYASAHNIATSTVGTMLEGTATLFRLEIRDGKTDIVGSYTDPELFRITQHTLFMHEGRVLVALTCVPNRLVILDAETMTLWRDVKLFPAEPIRVLASTVSPESVFTVYSLNLSSDGRYIVLENASDFIIYDIDKIAFSTRGSTDAFRADIVAAAIPGPPGNSRATQPLRPAPSALRSPGLSGRDGGR